jgi:hypothetical protein
MHAYESESQTVAGRELKTVAASEPLIAAVRRSVAITLGPGLTAKYPTAESVLESLRAAARETLAVIAKEEGL